MNNLAETKSADVRLRLEPNLKIEAARILAETGLELSMAIRMFLKQVVAHGGLPFEVRQPKAATVRAMREAQAMAKPRYGSAGELLDGLDRKAQGQAGAVAKKVRLHQGTRKRLARAAKMAAR